MAHHRDQTHGRWEARVRTSGAGWMSLFIIWPESDLWPDDGEYDWMEQRAGASMKGWVDGRLWYDIPANADLTH